MNEYVMETAKLTKHFGKTIALDNINISVPKGAIYGLIGENGAGKTTLFRIIAGLSGKTSGEFSLFGKSGSTEISEARKEIGCTIEAPAICGSMSVYENVKSQCIARGITDSNRIDEILSLVNLSEQRTKRALHLSYGMKQRLAIGMALLHNPKFLVLDEPTNGLDPMGIVEFRELFLKLNKEYGTTILIASHILNELEHLATHFGIIHKGRIIEQLTAEELADKCRKYIKIAVNDIPKATAILQDKLKTQKFDIKDNFIYLYDYLDSPADVSTVLSQNDVRVSEFSLSADDLEAYFTKAISRKEAIQ